MNSQAGKGSVAYIMKSEHNLDLPRRLQIEFSQVVQAREPTRGGGGEVTPAELWSIFSTEYLGLDTPLELVSVTSATGVRADRLRERDRERQGQAPGRSPARATGRCRLLDAISALGFRVRVLDYSEHALSAGGDALAAAYVECEVGSGEDSQVAWGVGMDPNIVTASLKAVHVRG